jgi:hypothetical protein
VRDGIKMDSLSFIQMSARYHELQKHKQQSTLDNASINIEKNDLTVDFMSLLESFEENFEYPNIVVEYMQTRQPKTIAPSDSATFVRVEADNAELTENTEKKLQRIYWIVGGMGLLLLLLILLVLYDYDVI